MNRFHNKYHRHNHHTTPSPNEPDAGHDPIASPEDPFRGDFHISGVLSATSASVGELVVEGKSTFNGGFVISTPISYILEHLSIVPVLTTQDYNFKLSTDFQAYPLMEIYLNNYPTIGDTYTAFYISTSTNIGVGTNDPKVALDVRGDIYCFNSTVDGALKTTGTLNVTGNSYFTGVTATKTSQFGYLEIGYVPGAQTYLKPLLGNKDLYLYAGNFVNLTLHAINTSTFTGRVGIGREPKETLTLKGQMGFRDNGFVLIDNSSFSSLRIITNRENIVTGLPNDTTQHLFSFADDGRFVIANMNHDVPYPCKVKIASSRSNVIDRIDSGKLMSLTNIASSVNANGPIFNFIRSNSVDLLTYTPILADQMIGGIYAAGYEDTTCLGGEPNAAIKFHAANLFTSTNQGAYTTFLTTLASSVTPLERLRVENNGNVGVNTFTTTVSPLAYRNTVSPDWKFTVADYSNSTQPAAVIIAGVAASPMMQVIGGEGVLEQVALRLSDRATTVNNTNHIEFTHGFPDMPIARVSSNNNAVGLGGSLTFATTHDSATPIDPYERLRVTKDGDVGIGITAPTSRLHVKDDSKTNTHGAGTNRDVVTISTANNTNGILLSSANLKSRIYNNNTDLDLHISTCTAGGAIKLDTANEAAAVVITSFGNVGIGINEDLDTFTTNTIKLGVNGDAMLFNSLSASPDDVGEGAKLWFNKKIQDNNTDPIYISRVNTAANNSELRINIGDDPCDDPLAITNTGRDMLNIGATVSSAWAPWLTVSSCLTKVTNNLAVGGDTLLFGTLSATKDVTASNNVTIAKNLNVNGNTTLKGALTTTGAALFESDVTIKGVLKLKDKLILDGDLYVSGNIYGAKDITAFWAGTPPGGWPSDIRLKNNIANLTNSLDKVSLINGVRFDWNEEKQTTHKGHDIGVIAQDIEKVLPEIVHTRADGYKTVQYEKIIPLLIECIKDLKSEIDILKSQK